MIRGRDLKFEKIVGNPNLRNQKNYKMPSGRIKRKRLHPCLAQLLGPHIARRLGFSQAGTVKQPSEKPDHQKIGDVNQDFETK